MSAAVPHPPEGGTPFTLKPHQGSLGIAARVVHPAKTAKQRNRGKRKRSTETCLQQAGTENIQRHGRWS